jgi:hypothetical protein
MRQEESWRRSAIRAELLALYREADSLLEGWACACVDPDSHGAPCCDFATTGREPYPTAVELREIRHAMSARPPGHRRRLPLSEKAPCPLLSDSGRCLIYASRPFGCRTFFCRDAEGPAGPRQPYPREAINAIGRRIADLSARFSPRDHAARPLARALGPSPPWAPRAGRQ